MIIKTFRDVEQELRKLRQEFANFKPVTSGGLSQAEVIALIQKNSSRLVINQPTQINSISDLDSAFNNGKILHQLPHQFLQGIESLFGNINNNTYAPPGQTDQVWFTGPTIPAQLITVYTDNGTPLSFLIKYTAGATEAVSEIYFVGNIGNTTDRVEKIWVKDLDISGTITGVSFVGSIAQANASASDTLTTSWADASGVSLSLTANGDYEITATCVFILTTNDTEAQGRIQHDDSGSFVSLTGIIRSSKDSPATLISTSSKSWKLTIASQPTTVKLQIQKPAGTGTSVSDITNTSIIAKRIT